MVGSIIIISVVFLGYILFKLTKNTMLKYILPPIGCFVYGAMLFFSAAGISAIYFYILALVPIIITLIIGINNYNLNKKN